MAANLTQGAIDKICNGDTEIRPYLQVTEVRLVSTSNQSSTNERFRMVVSDGVHTQQAMLATQRNDLVKSGKLQRGSIVQLLQFVCNLIQNRKIIIIIELDVVQEQCDFVGQPTLYSPAVGVRPAQLQSSADQTKTLNGNLQYGNPQSGGVPSVANLNSVGGPPLQSPQLERKPEVQPYGNSYANNSGPGRFSSTNPPMYARPGNAVASNTSSGYNNSMTRPVHQQPQPTYMNRGPIAKNEAAPRIIPISKLNPYQGRWTIKARVTAKGDLRRYSNSRGEGKVFNFDLLDAEGGEIRLTCFNEVVDQFFSQIEIGRVFLVSKGQLKSAQRAFNHLSSDYEIILDSSSIVQLCSDDGNAIPRQQFRFRPITDVEELEKGTPVDIIGIVSSINPSTTIMKKDNTETLKRTLQLRDMSGKSVEVTLWGDVCNTQGQELQSICDSGHFPVLAVKAGRVNDFNGKSVGTVSTSLLFIEPDFPEAHPLREWFDREGRNTQAQLISREGPSFSRTEVRKVISQIKDEKLGTLEKPDYITVSAHISFIKHDNFCYSACPLMTGERKCAKKVTNNGDGKWQCDKCDQLVDECEYRYILQCQIQDHTGVTWITVFQEFAEEIVGMPAKDLHYLKYEEQDDDKFSEILSRILFSKYLFKLKVKEETFSDEQRVKSTVLKVDRLDYSSESRFLVDWMTKQTSEASNNAVPTFANIQHQQQLTAAATQYGNPSYSTGNNMSGNTYVSASCSSCGGVGHSAANCPSVMSGPSGYTTRTPPAPSPAYGSGGPSGAECYKCHQTGHYARECPSSNGVAQSGAAGGGGGGGNGPCFKCNQHGHWARDCPSAAPPAYGMKKQYINGGY